MYEIEKELDEQIAVLRAELLGETVRASEVMAEKEEVACPECGYGVFPLERELGLLLGQWTPRVHEGLVLLST